MKSVGYKFAMNVLSTKIWLSFNPLRNSDNILISFHLITHIKLKTCKLPAWNACPAIVIIITLCTVFKFNKIFTAFKVLKHWLNPQCNMEVEPINSFAAA